MERSDGLFFFAREDLNEKISTAEMIVKIFSRSALDYYIIYKVKEAGNACRRFARTGIVTE